jgi:nucleoside phosphorylase
MSADCAIVTALSSELDKVLFHFRHAKQIVDEERGGRVFFETMSPSGLHLVGASSIGMGQLNAASLTRDVIDRYSPKSLILVGITGGLEKNIPLGDVVVSDQIIDYELGKVTPKGFEPRWSAYPVDSSILQKAQSFRNNSWVEYVRTERPDGIKNIDPKSNIGLYLCGNKVIADEKTAGALKSFWRKASAIEMEAAAIAAMLRQMTEPPSFIVIKGICDYADSSKNDNWQAYAADAAASFAYSFVTEQLAPSDIHWPPKKPNKIELEYRNLRITLQEVFDLSELRVLCIDMGFDWDEIAGTRKSEKIADLIQYAKRRSKLDTLILGSSIWTVLAWPDSHSFLASPAELYSAIYQRLTPSVYPDAAHRSAGAKSA